MINLKKVNIEFILSIIFFLLLLYVSIAYTYPILRHLNLIGNLATFELDATWGRQQALTQGLVIGLGAIIVVIFVVLRIRQLRK